MVPPEIPIILNIIQEGALVVLLQPLPQVYVLVIYNEWLLCCSFVVEVVGFPGLCLIGLGTDGGGSIRMPAAACGVVGVKGNA